MIVIGLTFLLVTVAAFWDWRTGFIPNWLTLPPLLLAPLCFFATGGGQGALFSVFGLIGCGLPPYILFRMGAIGGGDVKLFAALGAMNGFTRGTEMLMATLLVGALQAAALLFARGQLGQVLRGTGELVMNAFRPVARRKKIPPEALTQMRLGPAILIGTVLATVAL